MLGTEPMAVVPMATFTPPTPITPVGTPSKGGMSTMRRQRKRR